MPDSLKNILSKYQVKASAPCRVDSGGTWDIKAMALPMEAYKPTTVNMALTLRSSVTLSPFEAGWVKVASEGFPEGVSYPKNQISFEPPFGIFFAAICHFGFDGLAAYISSESPVLSGLGGSSTALVALVKALSKATARLGGKSLSAGRILHLSYHLEDGISGGNCGLQDQGAAVYGGVNQWHWRYSRPAPFDRISLLDRDGQKALSKRLLVAYSGKSHVSIRTNRKWIRDFHSGKTSAGWIKCNEILHQMGAAIRSENWPEACSLLREEMAIRREITPEAVIPVTADLIDRAEALGCGARFAGAGAGGAVWALGSLENIRRLRKAWKDALAHLKGGQVLQCEIDPAGVK